MGAPKGCFDDSRAVLLTDTGVAVVTGAGRNIGGRQRHPPSRAEPTSSSPPAPSGTSTVWPSRSKRSVGAPSGRRRPSPTSRSWLTGTAGEERFGRLDVVSTTSVAPCRLPPPRHDSRVPGRGVPLQSWPPLHAREWERGGRARCSVERRRRGRSSHSPRYGADHGRVPRIRHGQGASPTTPASRRRPSPAHQDQRHRRRLDRHLGPRLSCRATSCASRWEARTPPRAHRRRRGTSAARVPLLASAPAVPDAGRSLEIDGAPDAPTLGIRPARP